MKKRCEKGRISESEERQKLEKSPKKKNQNPESCKPNQAIKYFKRRKNQTPAATLDDTILFLFTKNNKAKQTPLLKPLYVECFHGIQSHQSYKSLNPANSQISMPVQLSPAR
jgi:hypothetical protein